MSNEAQVKIRRRALGRRLNQKAMDLSNVSGDLKGSPDLEFLSEKERKALDKQLSNIATIRTNLQKIAGLLVGDE